MRNCLLTIITILTSLLSFGQGKTVNSLRTGFWIEKSEGIDLDYTLYGNYKIIPLAQYDTIEGMGKTDYKIKYKGSSQLIFFNSKVGDRIDIKDSIWNHYDSKGRLRRTEFWIEGLNQWAKYYDENGSLTRYDFDDYENDTNFYFTYINGRVFKKAFYPPENKNRQTKVYYPDDPLAISDAELSFYVNFLSKTIDSSTIALTARKEITISSITSTQSFVKITDANLNPISFPLRIKANTSVPINVAVSPTSANYQTTTDTISIFTSESEHPYAIYTNIYADHINANTVETLSYIKLSKSGDKFLILPGMGSQTDAIITSTKTDNTRIKYKIDGITKIDLSEFGAGIYRLASLSCNTGGKLTLEITE
jgi:hypothetical protein